MINPQPLRLRMKRRKTVSVTPAMGASTVAGAILISPMERLAGTDFSGSARRTTVSAPPELSQDLRTDLFYLASQNESPRRSEGLISGLLRTAVAKNLVLRRLRWLGCVLSVLAAEALHAAGGIRSEER